MSTEIERKWLVAAMPGPDALGDGERLRQGYIARDGDVDVRVRITAAATKLTIKGGSGLSRTEVESELTQADGEALWPLTEGRRLEKVRYRVPVAGGTAEVDAYEGALEGLRTVEVEFDSIAAADAFTAPPWFGDELTGDPRWTNASLAEHGVPG